MENGCPHCECFTCAMLARGEYLLRKIGLANKLIRKKKSCKGTQ